LAVTPKEQDDPDPLDDDPVVEPLLLLELLEPLPDDDVPPQADEVTVAPVAALKFVLSVE
jgi:hypothetical protein